MKIHKFYSPSIPILFGLLLIVISVIQTPNTIADASGPERLIYFDPDSAQGNLGRLKDEMNRFMRKHNLGIQAQPVAQIDAFEKLIEEQPPTYIVVPQWYLKGNKEKQTIVPFMASLANGDTRYHKIIVVLKDSALQPADLKDKKIAIVSVNRQESYNLMADTLFRPHGLNPNDPQFILTSRDYDSLIALLLGKVDAAVVVKHSLTRLAEVNQAMVTRLKTIAESTPLPTPVLCRPDGKDSGTTAVVLAMQSTSDPNNPEKFMQLLGFNGWIKIPDTSRSNGGVRQ